jgi:hypothetical protein
MVIACQDKRSFCSAFEAFLEESGAVSPRCCHPILFHTRTRASLYDSTNELSPFLVNLSTYVSTCSGILAALSALLFFEPSRLTARSFLRTF